MNNILKDLLFVFEYRCFIQLKKQIKIKINYQRTNFNKIKIIKRN